MNPVRKLLNNVKPAFEEGGKLHMFKSVFDGFETFLFVPSETSKSGVHIHDAYDSKRMMSIVVIALIPALLFGMYNIGYQHFLVTGTLAEVGFWTVFLYGFFSVLPKLIVSYGVGLGIEFIVAQWKNDEIHEGFLVSGILIPMIVPVDTPLWMLALATAFAVIFAKEVFGGTGMNIFNVALVARAFLFFSYPTKMSGDHWVAYGNVLGIGGFDPHTVDGFSGATPLGQIAVGESYATLTNVIGQPLSIWDMIIGFIPGSIGETSIIAIALGAALLLFTGVASWKIMLSVFVGGGLTAFLFNVIGPNTAVAQMPWEYHLILGGFAFGAVFMATDPVTGSRTETGKWIYGLLIGVMAIVIRVMNPSYPEGIMLAILLMNVFAPMIDYYVVQANIKRRMKRVKVANGNQESKK